MKIVNCSAVLQQKLTLCILSYVLCTRGDFSGFVSRLEHFDRIRRLTGLVAYSEILNPKSQVNAFYPNF